MFLSPRVVTSRHPVLLASSSVKIQLQVGINAAPVDFNKHILDSTVLSRHPFRDIDVSCQCPHQHRTTTSTQTQATMDHSTRSKDKYSHLDFIVGDGRRYLFTLPPANWNRIRDITISSMEAGAVHVVTTWRPARVYHRRNTVSDTSEESD